AHLERLFLRTVLPAIAIGELLRLSQAAPLRSVSVLRSSHFTHSTVIGSIISGSRAVVVAQLAARPLLTISAFRAKFGLRVIWLSAVRFAAEPTGGRVVSYGTPAAFE